MSIISTIPSYDYSNPDHSAQSNEMVLPVQAPEAPELSEWFMVFVLWSGCALVAIGVRVASIWQHRHAIALGTFKLACMLVVAAAAWMAFCIIAMKAGAR